MVWLSYVIPKKQTLIHKSINRAQAKESVKKIEQPAVNEPFSPDDDVYEFIQRYIHTTFDGYDELADDMRKQFSRYIKVIMLPQCLVLNLGQGETQINSSIALTTSFRTLTPDGVKVIATDVISNYIFTAGIGMKRFIPIYKNLTFHPDPSKVRIGEYNTYPGMKASYVETVDMNLVNPILNHIRTCWASDDPDIYDYILQWLRVAFSQPGTKTGTVLILYGVEGTGKGFLLDNLIIPYIYGDTIATTTHGLTQITQRFNSILMNKLFICCNEVSTQGQFHSSFEKLKAIITDPTISIEKKGIDIFNSYPNHCNFVFTTNNLDSVKLGKSDRRYVCLETSDRYKGNYEYFANLMSYCDQTTANHFYTYISGLAKTRNVKRIPNTRLKTEMQMNAFSSVDKFYDDMLEAINDRDIIRREDYDMDEWELLIRSVVVVHGGRVCIPASQFYDTYKRYCAQNGHTHKTAPIMRRTLLRHIKQIKTNRGIYYVLDPVITISAADIQRRNSRVDELDIS